MKQTIEIPEGYELVKVSDTEYKIQKKERVLPKTWEEFCELSPYIKGKEHFINGASYIIKQNTCELRDPITDANVLPSKEAAEAVLALCQLIQLRDYYNGGWKPDWSDNAFDKHCILFVNEKINNVTICSNNRHILVFKTRELRDEFLKNFKDLIVKLKALYP